MGNIVKQLNMKTTNILFSLLAITATANAAIPVRMAKSADSRMLHDETQTTFSKGKLDTKAFTRMRKRWRETEILRAIDDDRRRKFGIDAYVMRFMQ